MVEKAFHLLSLSSVGAILQAVQINKAYAVGFSKKSRRLHKKTAETRTNYQDPAVFFRDLQVITLSVSDEMSPIT